MQASSKSNTLPKAKLRLRYFTPREVGAFLLHLLLFSPAPCLNRMLVLLFHSYNCSFLLFRLQTCIPFQRIFIFHKMYAFDNGMFPSKLWFVIHPIFHYPLSFHLFLQLCIAWEQFKRRSGCTIIQLSFYSFIVLQQLGRKTTNKQPMIIFPQLFWQKMRFYWSRISFCPS